MAKDKKSFIFYCDWKDTFDQLPNEKAGQLIKHMLAYTNDEDPYTDDLLINAVFANIKNTLKRDLKKFEQIIEKRSAAGKASAKKRAQQKATNSTRVKSVQQKPTNSTDSVSDSVSDSDSDIKKNTIPLKSFSPAVENVFLSVVNLFPENTQPKDSMKKIRWKTEIDKILRLDNIEEQTLIDVIKWARTHDFWKDQFLSIQKLRRTDKSSVKYIHVFLEKFKSKSNGKTQGAYSTKRTKDDFGFKGK